MSRVDKVLDRVGEALEVGVNAYVKLEKKAEPVTKVIGSGLEIFANEIESIISRPVDWALFIYFTTHIPITIFFDLQCLYPPQWIPSFFRQLNGSYLRFLNDPFMNCELATKYWFMSYAFCEAFLQLPFFFFAAYGVYYDKRWIRLPLVVYGAHVMTTVIPCLVEIFFNSSYELLEFQRNILLFLYFPYFLIPFIGLVDSCIRITKAIKLKDEKESKLAEKKLE